MLCGIIAHYLILILILYFNQSDASDCELNECCQKPWIVNDIFEFSLSLKSDLFGQFIVQKSVPILVEAHLNNRSPHKPLVLSFHGSPGTGKTWVSKLLAQNLYAKGYNSKFVQSIAVPLLFRDTIQTQEQIEGLHRTIKSSLIRCPQTLFIFEDVNAMNSMVLDSLLPFVEAAPSREGVEFRKAIYILICNTAAPRITDYLTEKFILGRDRRSITREEMQRVISDKIFIEAGAFKNSEFVSREVVDAYIPFLPLEKNHVKKCILRAIEQRDYEPDLSMVLGILDDIVWISNGVEMFAESGCKRIEQIISMYLED